MKNYYPNLFKRFIHIGLDLLFPRKCLGCGKNSTWLCPDCLNRLPCSYSPIEDKIFSVFEYNTPVVKQVIWRLKYKRTLELTETLAKPMHDVLLEELEDELIVAENPKFDFEGTRSRTSGFPKIILIPAPLSPARSRSRGYNQAEELAKQIARLNPDQFAVRTDLIKKIKDTPSQVSIKNRADRLANLKNAFALSLPRGTLGSQISGSIFVIIDDVSTTGATINEIRQLLVRAGLNHIYGLVVAHG